MKASLLVTCLGDALFARVGLAAVEVLRSLGVSVDFPDGQTCCGQPAYNAGYRDQARDMARAFLRAFADSECVVSISGSCAAMVREGFVELFAGHREAGEAQALAARTFEFSEFVADVLDVRELPAKWSGCATLHHSCHARRALGVIEQPERLLHMVEGLEYRSLPHAERCCGFGGTFSVKMPDVSTAIVDEKVDDILASGARLVVGLDMSCLMNIEGRLRRRGSGLAVMHLAELLATAWQR